MNIQLLRTLIALQSVPAPDPQPESLQPKPPWEGDDVRPPESVVVGVSEGAARRLRELVEAPEPPVVVAAPVEDPLDALSQKMEELYTIFTPPRGRVVEQAKGPNRQQRRARGIYGKRGKR